MKRDIIVAEGLFSKLSITLNDETVQKFARIPKNDNPLASVEMKLKEVLNEFETAYFAYTHKHVEDAPAEPNPGEA